MTVLSTSPTNTPLTTNSMTLLTKRYLDGGTVDAMWDRVSGGNKTFRNLLSSLRFLPNSPTLFNLGKNNGCTSSACFCFDIEDSMFGKGSITDTRNKAIAVAKAGGGVGYYGGKLRPKGSPIKSIHRVACGPVTVMRDYHGVSTMITQGGKRELAQMFVLPCWHDDIREFIHAKDSDPQSLSSFNQSVSWTNEWIDKVDTAAKDRSTCNQETGLWWEQCKSAWAHGCPGMFFHDTVNRGNPNKELGSINTPNPCGETPNRSAEPCNLGSLSLPRYFTSSNRGIDFDQLSQDAYSATLFLDDILDRNEFPHPDITTAAFLTRKLGLGVMGWADLLALLHIHYDTLDAINLGTRIMKTINDAAHQASEDLAQTKGPYTGYDAVKTNAPMRRNETNTSIAPTGTIAIIAGVWGSIEPHYALRCERTTSEGIKMQDGISDWVWDQLDGFIPKTAHEIPLEWHIRHQAAFQQHTDLGVSKSINMPNSATIEDVSRAYKMLYDTGCKGGTIFRDGCRSEQVLVKEKTKSVYSTGVKSEPHTTPIKPQSVADETLMTVNTAVQQEVLKRMKDSMHTEPKVIVVTPSTNPHRKLPARVSSERVKFKVGGTEFFLHHGWYEDHTLGEIFISGNFGTTMTGLLNSFCITFSVALQHGTPLSSLIENHRNTRFEPSGHTDNDDVPICTSIPDLIVHWLAHHYLGENDKTIKNGPRRGSGIFCPDCGAEAIYQAGCLLCVQESCHWSRCG